MHSIKNWFYKIVFLVCIFLKNVTASSVTQSEKNTDWSRSEILDTNGLYLLEWKIIENNIIFQTTVNTRGYIGLGFSYKNENMSGSDLILAWVDDNTGKPNILDCHGSLKGNTVVQDDTQNYILIDGYQNSTHTQIQFRRALETCDPHDIQLGGNTVKVLWSFGKNDPDQGSFKSHGRNKGAKTLYLTGKMTKKPHSNRIKHWDVTVKNISIDVHTDTLYWCKIFKGPNLPTKHHIIGYEALLTKELTTSKPLVHHMTLFECSMLTYPGTDSLTWDVWVNSKGAVCSSNLLTPRDWDACLDPVATWSVGASGQFFPEHVGISMGGSTGPKYYMLEVHYDNPQDKHVIDHSGFRIHYTNKLRANDGGILISGISVSDTLMIPPNQHFYRNVGICGPSCTKHLFPEEGIKIVSASLHSHTAGRKIKLRHIRNGTELDRIVEDDNYDHSYQQVRQLENETTILIGDYLITDCAFQTLGRKRPTLGGYSTKQEMCLSFITYYPKTELTGCYSMIPVKEFFETFGVYQFYSMNMTDVENLFLYNGNILDLLPSQHNDEKSIDLHGQKKKTNEAQLDIEEILFNESILNKLTISEPAEFHDRTFLEHLKNLPWSEPLFTRKVETTLLTGKHMTFCRVSNESVSPPAEIFVYPNFTTLVKPASNCPYYHVLISNTSNINHFNILYIILSLILSMSQLNQII